jgi:hypothetical protein
MAWGLSGLVAGELTKLVFLECCTPCTMEVLRLWAYEPEGLRSRVLPRMRSGLELLLGMVTWGVCERGDLVREEAVSARPRVWLGSREAEEGLSIWCDAFPAACRACRSGKGAAAADKALVSPSPQKLLQRVGPDTARRGGQFGAPTPRSRLFHGNSLRFGQGGTAKEKGTHTCRWLRAAHCPGGPKKTAGCPTWLRVVEGPAERATSAMGCMALDEIAVIPAPFLNATRWMLARWMRGWPRHPEINGLHLQCGAIRNTHVADMLDHTYGGAGGASTV